MARDPNDGPADEPEGRDADENEEKGDGDQHHQDPSDIDTASQAGDDSERETSEAGDAQSRDASQRETRQGNTVPEYPSEGEPRDRSTGFRATQKRGRSRRTTDSLEQDPYVSLTIEGEYERVIERVRHPQAFQHSELNRIMENLENTLLAVVGTGGGIRSEIYEAVDFELDEPWEIRMYLEVLAMHDLIRLHDDQWIPSYHFEQVNGDDEPG